MKKIPTKSPTSPILMLAALGAVAIPAVVWVLCKASQIESVAKVLEKLK